jgi:hypothetical protein
LNVPFQNGPIQGEDVFVPLDFIIGGPQMAGQGWRMLVEQLSVGRCISLPSSGTGGAKAGVFATGAYARIRRQFNMPVGRFEGIESVIARMVGLTYTMDAARSVAAGAIDGGEKPSVPSAMLEYHVTEMARQVANDAMDVHGGKGICLGPRNYLGRGYQVVPVAITVEGANILTRSLIIFGQGAIRCHPFVLKENGSRARSGSPAWRRGLRSCLVRSRRLHTQQCSALVHHGADRCALHGRAGHRRGDALLPTHRALLGEFRVRGRRRDAESRRLSEEKEKSIGTPRRRSVLVYISPRWCSSTTKTKVASPKIYRSSNGHAAICSTKRKSNCTPSYAIFRCARSRR